MENKHGKQRKIVRQQEAQERQLKWNNLNPEQKLEFLDKKLGKGKGAIKQREKIKGQIREFIKKHKDG